MEQYLLADLKIKLRNIPALFCENLNAIQIAANPVFHERTKHLDIDCHILRENAQNGTLKLLPIRGHDQLGDFFTKGLLP